jgi:hypothetical protein
MAKVIRYALAAICLAASVGCLTLWWRSEYRENHCFSMRCRTFPARRLWCETNSGLAFVTAYSDKGGQSFGSTWRYTPFDRTIPSQKEVRKLTQASGYFGIVRNLYYFPLWYSALLFALAAVAAIRVGRRFTLRSTIVATTIVAALLGMVVAL